MLVALFVGVPIGLHIGVLSGGLVFKKLFKRTVHDFLRLCDESADDNPDIEFPEMQNNVSFFKQRLLVDTSPALVDPGFERVRFLNKILTQLWPHLSPAIHKEVIAQSRDPIQEALKKVPVIKDIRIDVLDLGSRPFRLDSVKTYESSGEELVVEAPLFWGGDIVLRVTAEAELGGKIVDLPVEISCIQFKVLARITINPLVRQLPCAGGLTISLLEVPTLELDIRILDSPDLLSCPPLPALLRTVVHVVTSKMLVYPNQFSIPIMPNYGLPPPPKGILQVTVVSGHDLKSSLFDKVDPYVCLEVREGKPVYTATFENEENPVWNELKELVVDDFQKQQLTLTLFDDELINSELLGGLKLSLEDAEFIANPRETFKYRLPVYHPRIRGVYPTFTSTDMKAAKGDAFMDEKVSEAVAQMPQNRTLIARLRRKKAAEKARKKARKELIEQGALAEQPSSPSGTTLNEGGDESEVSSKPKGTAGDIVGSLTVAIKFIPFQHADTTDASSFLRRRLTFSKSHVSHISGVLSVHVVKGQHFGRPVSSFIELDLHDPGRLPLPNIKMKSGIELHEQNPKYNFEADFVRISNKSRLTVTVFERPGIFDSPLSRLPLMKQPEPKMLGFVHIDIEDVVDIEKLQDNFALRGAQTGELYVKLHWFELQTDDVD